METSIWIHNESLCYAFLFMSSIKHDIEYLKETVFHNDNLGAHIDKVRFIHGMILSNRKIIIWRQWEWYLVASHNCVSSLSYCCYLLSSKALPVLLVRPPLPASHFLLIFSQTATTTHDLNLLSTAFWNGFLAVTFILKPNYVFRAFLPPSAWKRPVKRPHSSW